MAVSVRMLLFVVPFQNLMDVTEKDLSDSTSEGTGVVVVNDQGPSP